MIVLVVIVAFLGYRKFAGGSGKRSPPQLTGTQMAPPPKAPPPPTTGPGLPPGWIAAVDPASGHTYYVNQTTGASTWTNPSTGV